MAPWLEGVLGHLSALEAVLSFLGSMVVALIPVFVRIHKQLREAQKAMLSVPPTTPPERGEGDGGESEGPRVPATEPWVYEQRIRELTDELRTVGEDHARTARALDATEKRLAMLRAHVAELERGGGGGGEVVGHETPTVRPRK